MITFQHVFKKVDIQNVFINDRVPQIQRAGYLHVNNNNNTCAISQFPNLFSQNQRQLKGYNAALVAGQLPVERGLAVLDPEVLERRALIREVMCHFRVELELARFATEWADLQALAADGLVSLSQNGDLGLVEVTHDGRWLIRTIAAVFDPAQRQQASGSRLI